MYYSLTTLLINKNKEKYRKNIIRFVVVVVFETTPLRSQQEY